MKEISILPITVGFDVRDYDMPVDLRHTKATTIRYLDETGCDRVGNLEDPTTIESLLDAGYDVRR